MRRVTGRVELDRADDRVSVVDGSEWITNPIERQSVPLDDLGLEFYHLAENVPKGRRAVHGEENLKAAEQLVNFGPSGNDPVPEVSGTGPANRERPDGIDVQGNDATDQGSGHALGRRQRGEQHVLGSPGAKWCVKRLLGEAARPRRLTPERFATPVVFLFPFFR